jgi:hypothetical protein
VQTMEVVTGAPPAEFGDKTRLIINVTTHPVSAGTSPLARFCRNMARSARGPRD